jgi:hypothetical protein
MTKSCVRVPYLRVIRSPRYFPLWLGQIVSNLGDTLNYVALVVLVFRLSQPRGEPTQLGALGGHRLQLLIKRSMCGKAGFALLRRRVLAAA